MGTILRAVLLAVLTYACIACEPAPKTAEGPRYAAAKPTKEQHVTYRFAVHPLHNPHKLNQTYQPLIDYLNRQLPDQRFELEAARDYQVYEARFRSREPEFLLPNPWQTLEAIKVGYSVIAMAGDAADFKGLIIVRKDAGIHSPKDLRGKAVSYPSPTAVAAGIMPQYFLYQHGIDINRDIENRYVGSQESSIMNAYLQHTAAAATWPPPWRAFQKDHPLEAEKLQVMWETESLPNNSVMVRNDVSTAVREKVRKALFDLGHTNEGRQILADLETAYFHPANDANYAVVQKFIDNFERKVRPVERK